MADRKEIWQKVKPYLKCSVANDDTEEQIHPAAEFFHTICAHRCMSPPSPMAQSFNCP